MGYLKSIITYNVPSEADVDKSMLESHGITVNLLNANVARAEIGAPFYIQLQVPDEQYDEAVSILRELRPERFGSAAVVKQIEAGIVRAVVRFAAIGFACSLLIFCFVARSQPLGQRLTLSLVLGFLSGGLLPLIYGLVRPKSKRVVPSSPPTPPKGG